MSRKSSKALAAKLLEHRSRPLPSGSTVAVIGGGLAGCSAANALATGGARVRLYEREAALATQTSAHPGAVVFPMVAKHPTVLRRFYESAFARILAKIEAVEQTEHFGDWHPVGAIHLLVNERLEQLRNGLDRTGMAETHVQAWNANQTAEATGGLIREAALAYPTAGYIDPRAWCRTLSRQPNIEILHQRVTALEPDGDGWLITTAEGTSKAAAVVLANGLAVLRFKQTAWLPLNCFRGQLAYIPVEHAPDFPTQVICHEGYLIPNCSVGHLAGATFHPTDRNAHLASASQKHLMVQLERWLPWFLKKAPPLKGRVAFRAQSPDHLPMIGPVANHEAFVRDFAELHHGRIGRTYPEPEYLPNLYVSTGHASRGTVSCWVAGEIIATMILGGVPVLEPALIAELNPARFIFRTLRRNQRLAVPAIAPENLPPQLKP